MPAINKYNFQPVISRYNQDLRKTKEHGVQIGIGRAGGFDIPQRNDNVRQH
jgi:hypothetical protein